MARLRAGMTIEALAYCAGVASSTIDNVEYGRTDVRVYTLWRIADCLGVTLTELVEED